ncbi:MAG TPA: tetratricopeptide repeat protein [Candidatus Bathyarchaeia archaeon]|nr:tetratricopeptide repeat protein [Candidatus Bathyarchaeia archaeon]
MLALRAALPLALLAACIAPPPAAQTPSGEAAMIDANRRADAYLRGGDLEGAARQYREAIRVAQTVEDTEGIATNAINLSIVYQRLGRTEDARASLGLLLDRSTLAFSQERMAQAAVRRAVLDMDDRRAASAGEWLDRAAGYCGRGCSVSATIQNVRGQLALDAGRPDQAAASARAALAVSRASGDRAESANALRLLGAVAIRGGDAASASAYLGEALAIDRELGLPRKIYLDLIALGRASALRGDRAAARSFYERARAVSEADRDGAGTAQAKALIEALGDTMQAKQPSPGQP